MMPRKIDPRLLNTFLDATVLHRKGDVEDEVVEEILRTAFERRVVLILPHSVKDEISHSNTPSEVKSRAQGLIYSTPVQLTVAEKELHRRVRHVIRGNAKAGKHDADAFHLVESDKHGGGYFLTNDKRLLRKKTELSHLLQIEIVTPTEFLSVLKNFEAQDRWPSTSMSAVPPRS